MNEEQKWVLKRHGMTAGELKAFVWWLHRGLVVSEEFDGLGMDVSPVSFFRDLYSACDIVLRDLEEKEVKK